MGMADDKSGSKKDDLSQQILDLTAQYYDEAFPKKPFLGGISQIPVSGKVFDGDELKNLVDSSLDFWLTTGRYAHEFEEEVDDIPKIITRLFYLYPSIMS